MAKPIQDTTFNTSYVEPNEVIKASDFEFAFRSLINNVSKSTQMMLESNQDFVINGKVLPSSGMRLKVSPIYGVCKADGLPFGRTEEADMDYAFEGSTSGRVDIIEVRGDWQTYDEQQRAFNDPDTDTLTYQNVNTKEYMYPKYQIKQGVEGSSVAPTVDSGWVKLAEVVIRAGASSILASDIKNITADVAGMENEDWTTEKDITYNIGYISDVNARFRVQHNADGTHAEDSIDSDSLDIGTGAKQINANILPFGNTVTIPGQSAVSADDSIVSVISKAVAVITSLYNKYLLYGNYGFNGEISISAIADANNVLTNPLKFSAAGDGTATIKIGSSTVLTIDSNGKLHTNGYSVIAADNVNTVVTKAVTDALSTAISSLDTRVSNLEAVGTQSEYINGSLSMGSDGRYNPDSISIYAATTTNITLSGLQTIDGVELTDSVFVLVKNQTDAKENGIYQVSSSSTWSRVSDFDTPDEIKGKIFLVNNGTANGKRMFYVPKVAFLDSSSFGTDEIPFLEYMATPKAIANRAIIRDANGRAKVAAPLESDDIARKYEVDTVNTRVSNLYDTTIPGTAPGTAAVGSATTFARSDHVHPIPTSINFGGGMWRCVATWGSQVGTAFGGWDDATGGSVVFRCNNPAAGQMSMVIDGTIYVDDGQYPVIHTGNIGSQSVNYANSAGSTSRATRADNADVADYVSSGNTGISVDYANDFTGLRWAMYSNQNFPGQYGNLIQMQTDTGPTTRWGYQLFFATNDNIYYRKWVNTTEMSTWKCIITSNNIGSQTVANANYASYACCMCNIHNTPATCGGVDRATIQSKSFYWPTGTCYETIWNDITSFLPVRYGDYYPIIWGVQRCNVSGCIPTNISAWAVQYTPDGNCVKIGNQIIDRANGWVSVTCDTILTVAQGIE